MLPMDTGDAALSGLWGQVEQNVSQSSTEQYATFCHQHKDKTAFLVLDFSSQAHIS